MPQPGICTAADFYIQQLAGSAAPTYQSLIQGQENNPKARIDYRTSGYIFFGTLLLLFAEYVL